MKGKVFLVLALLLVGFLFLAVASSPALAANGAQHGWLEVTLTDADGAAASSEYVVASGGAVYRWQNLTGFWEKTSKACVSWNKAGNCNGWGTASTENLYENPPGSTGSPCGGNAQACQYKDNQWDIDYKWKWECGGWRLVSSSGLQITPITLYVNAWAAVESWMSNKKTFPAPLGKYSFSIGPGRITAAGMSLTKDDETIGDMDILSIVGTRNENFVFPPEHPATASGPPHGANQFVNAILALDSAPNNNSDNGDMAFITDPPSFTIDDVGEYQVTVMMTVKGADVEGSSETVTGKSTVTVSYEGTGGALCEGESAPQ